MDSGHSLKAEPAESAGLLNAESGTLGTAPTFLSSTNEWVYSWKGGRLKWKRFGGFLIIQ